MRIRSIKPEFWRSDDITALDWETRLLFVGLWSYVDDNGVGIDKLASITADLFAGDLEDDAPDTFARVSRGLQKLQEAGRITRYIADGKRYLYITNWGKHQRIDHPNRARYPLPTSENDESLADDTETSRESREDVATGTEEQRNRGKKKTSSNPRLDTVMVNAKFAALWDVCARKVKKQDAKTAFVKALKTGTDPDVIIDGMRRYTEYVVAEKKDREVIAHPATWINGARWEDELETGPATVLPIGDPEEWLRRLWHDGDVGPIEKATSLVYPDPDLPMDVITAEQVKQFHLTQRRTWIADHKDEILRRLSMKEAA